jgi:hypothetical protein
MSTVQSRMLKCGLGAILAWACFDCSFGQPSAVGAENGDLTETEQNAVEVALCRLADLRTLDMCEVQKREAEGRKKSYIYLGPAIDCKRSVPRIGYCVYAGLFMMGDHYYEGKLIRADYDDFLGFSTPHIKAALSKKYGKPEPGPKFEWMKVRSHLEVEERCHWNIQVTITQKGKPTEINVACELTFRKDHSVIVSLIDTERAELVGKALCRK